MAVKRTGQPSFVEALMPKGAGANAALDRLAARATARAKINEQFVKDIANAPATHACGASAAELAFRRSVQPRN